MTIAYLILAHNNPCHLRRLVESVTSPTSLCFVHVDKKSKLEDVLPSTPKNVVLSERRIAVYWGDYSMVEATLCLMQQALAHPAGFDRLVLLSGVDLPLRSASEIEQYFDNHPDEEFINLVTMPAVEERKDMGRLTNLLVRPQAPFVLRFLHKVRRRLGIRMNVRERIYRKVLGHLVPYAGDQWWALSREACEYVMAFVKRESKIMRFFKGTYCADEMFFQIVLGNSPFQSRIRRNVTYVDWLSDPGAANPALMNEQHLDELFACKFSFPADGWYGAGDILFARKFSDENKNVADSVMRRISAT